MRAWDGVVVGAGIRACGAAALAVCLVLCAASARVAAVRSNSRPSLQCQTTLSNTVHLIDRSTLSELHTCARRLGVCWRTCDSAGTSSPPTWPAAAEAQTVLEDKRWDSPSTESECRRRVDTTEALSDRLEHEVLTCESTLKACRARCQGHPPVDGGAGGCPAVGVCNSSAVSRVCDDVSNALAALQTAAGSTAAVREADAAVAATGDAWACTVAHPDVVAQLSGAKTLNDAVRALVRGATVEPDCSSARRRFAGLVREFSDRGNVTGRTHCFRRSPELVQATEQLFGSQSAIARYAVAGALADAYETRRSFSAVVDENRHAAAAVIAVGFFIGSLLLPRAPPGIWATLRRFTTVAVIVFIVSVATATYGLSQQNVWEARINAVLNGVCEGATDETACVENYARSDSRVLEAFVTSMGDVILNRAPVALVKKATQAITVFFDHFSWHQILLLLAFASVAVVLMIIVAAACAGMRSGGQLWIPLPIGVAIVIGTPSPERMTAGRSELSIAATRLRDYLETRSDSADQAETIRNISRRIRKRLTEDAAAAKGATK